MHQKKEEDTNRMFPHGGDVRTLARNVGCAVSDLLDFSANINPLGPPDGLRQVIARNVSEVIHYPDPQCRALREAIGVALSVSPERVVCGNGSTELLFALPAVLGVRRAIIPVPSYADYVTAVVRAGLVLKTLALSPEKNFEIDWSLIETELVGDELVIVGQPGNPSGMTFKVDGLLDLAKRYPRSFFLVDEAFADFVEGYTSLATQEQPNIIVMRSMTKFFAIPGIRLGYLVAAEPLVRSVAEHLPPWSVGSLAQAVGVGVLTLPNQADAIRKEVTRLRGRLQRALESLGVFHVFPAVANYLLVRVDGAGWEVRTLAEQLLRKHRIAIRMCENYVGLDARYFRVAVRTEAENERFVDALEAEIGLLTTQPARRHPVRTPLVRVPAVMFQGTSSNAGKSVLTAAFCRILLQDGYRVAPFKAQNMSLNSFVTRDGGEMGRAQVVQAQASRREPDVRMNPILLKPNSETGSQVILCGKPVGNMDVEAYIRYKPQAFEVVRRAYDSLAAEVDVMVLEGAGSPGEVNLKRHDIVNMAMAEYAQAPVLIVGDIDRGGVFASFIGTLDVLSEKERACVAGFIVNRFRGRRELLDEALVYVRNHTGLPTLGIVPYLRDLGLPEEDSVSFKAFSEKPAQRTEGIIDIAMIDLPHISNFTDVDALKIEPDVCIRIVRRPEQLGTPDAIILPGSKNVLADLQALRENGLAARILACVDAGHTCVVGLCGGFQMLGRSVADPTGVESSARIQPGLDVLPVETVLLKDKTLKGVTARHAASGHSLRGYEIHHGQTRGEGLVPAVVREDGEPIGFASPDGRILGTYLHGFFDSDPFRRWFINDLRRRRGLSAWEGLPTVFDIEPALDRLAEVVRENLDIQHIYRRMGLT